MKSKDYIFECLKRGDEISANFETVGSVSLKDVNLKHVIFDNCVFNDRFLLTEISDVINIEFLNCTFNEYFSLEDVEHASTIIFKSCTFKKWIELENLTSSFLNIENCSNHHSFTLKNVKVEDVSFAAEEVSFEGTLIIDSLEQKEITFTSLSSSYFGRIILENFHKVEIDANVHRLELGASVFKSLELYSSKETNSISELLITDIHFEGNILLEDVSVGLMSIANASCNKGMLTIAHSELIDFEVNNCQIDNFTLNQVEFVKPPEMLGSNLKTWRLSGVIWADRKRSLKDSYLSKKIMWFYWLFKRVLGEKFTYNEDHIETYRQLKTASIANNNLIDTLAFYRNEMKLYWKLVRIEGGIPLNDRILVFINRISSDFGQSWILPLVWLFLITGLYYFKLDSPSLSCYPTDWWNGFLEMLSYLNPFRKIPEGTAKIQIGLDVLFKVVSAYFVYHFIRATRKFGKV